MRNGVGVAAIATLVTLTALSMPVSAAGAGDVGSRGGAPCPSFRERVVRDVAYVAERVSGLQRLDLYVPERAKSCRLVPIVVWVHGGSWTPGDKRAAAETKADATGLLHADVNRLIGTPDDTRMTPAVTGFVTDCLGQSP